MNVLSVKNISKRYPGVVALDDVSVDFRAGEVHALLGENGAGKSTLIKVMAGAVENDSGTIEIDGQTIKKMTPALSRGHGIEVIYQEYNLIPALSVAENICLGSRRGMTVDRGHMNQIAREVFAGMNINIDPSLPVRELSVAQQQLVEIAKAVSKNSKIIIMDEPTAQLTATEVGNLYYIIKSLKEKGVLIIYISHRMEEIFAVTDRVTVMRDGRMVKTVNTSETNRDKLIELMVGRELTASYPQRKPAEEAPPVLEVRGLYGEKSTDISFVLRKGEILGLAGLVGAGRTELVRTVFGADRMLGGQILINGSPVSVSSPEDAMRHGMGLIPEDRKMQGCFLGMAIDWNIAVSTLKTLSKNGVVNDRAIRELADKYHKRLSIKAASDTQLVGTLSGGNQQKVVLAKVLASGCDIIIFDEPTRGIDVGARHEIYELMNELVTKEGKSIIMISSDMEELMGMSDRIMVIAEGKVTGELKKEEFSQTKILSLASA